MLKRAGLSYANFLSQDRDEKLRLALELAVVAEWTQSHALLA